ncbi:MAG: hypothetical protein Q8M94_21375, partial [Ignavibacteria bacterium]|nr:hypothetical protein [Ignavibacteria bacterium]
MTVKIYFDPTGKLVVDNEGTASAAWLARRSQIELCVDRLTAGTITSKTITLGVTDTMGDVKIQAGKTDFTNTESGFILGIDDSDANKAKFYLGDASNYLNWTGSALNISGAISAGTIDIGGDDATSFHVDADGGIWSGASVANKATAPFRVSNAGALVATSATITGAITSTSGTIGGFTLSSTALYAGTTTTRIQLDTTSGIHLGATAFADAPFRVSLAGVLVATSATITGAITASSGSVGSFTIGTYLYTGTKTAYNDANAGVHLGSDGLGIGNNVFTVSSAGALVATSATITGVITANTGYLGGTSGWVISAGYIKDVAGIVGLSAVVTVGDDIRFWAGHATPASAPFSVTEAGVLKATSAKIGGWTVNTTSIYTGTEDHAAYTANAGDITIYSDGSDAS